jgi:hypothetical protein
MLSDGDIVLNKNETQLNWVNKEYFRVWYLHVWGLSEWR